MKRIVALSLLLVLCVGCSGVIMNASYSKLLDQTAALSQETADRAVAGTLSPDDMKAALVSQAAVWQHFRAGRDGKAGE
jgi:uncharacterized protein YcfL